MSARGAAWSVLALLLVALVGGAATYAGPPTGPALGAETTFALAVESLARDGDLRLDRTDRERFKNVWGWPAENPEVLEGSERLAAPAISVAWHAPWVQLFGRRGIFLGSAVALALAALAAAAATRSAGPVAPLLVALAVFGSTAFHAPYRFDPACVLTMLVVGSLALARGRERADEEPPSEMFADAGAAAPAVTIGSLAASGALLGLAIVDDLTLAPLLGALAVAAAERRARVGRGIRIGTVLAGAVVALAGGLAVVGAQWTLPQPSLDAALFGWNLADLACGRHVGLLVWQLPLLALVAGATRKNGRFALPLAVAAALALRLFLQPFDWAGREVGPAGLALLPILAALWLWPGRRVSMAWMAVVAAGCGLLLGPLWLAPRAGVADLAAGRGPARGLLARLPFETALRRLPGLVEVEEAGAHLRAVGPTVWEGKRGLEMMGDARAELTVASPHRLTLVRLEFGGTAPVELAVAGARAGNTIFRPGGGVAFDLQLERPARRHPTAWSREPVLFYPLSIRLPAGKPAPLPFALSLARAAVPHEGAVP